MNQEEVSSTASQLGHSQSASLEEESSQAGQATHDGHEHHQGHNMKETHHDH